MSEFLIILYLLCFSLMRVISLGHSDHHTSTAFYIFITLRCCITAGFVILSPTIIPLIIWYVIDTLFDLLFRKSLYQSFVSIATNMKIASDKSTWYRAAFVTSILSIIWDFSFWWLIH